MNGSVEVAELSARCLEAAEANPEQPTAAAAEALLAAASEWQASDVHVSPEADGFRVRFRLDGVLLDVARLPRERLPLFVQRLKVLGGLLTYKSDVPQDGRIPAESNGGRCELRLATIPTLHGERALLRLMDSAQAPRTLAELGWPPPAQAALAAASARRQGLVVFAGPAGSGKTTAIYAALRALAQTGERCLVSVEEPVESALPGVDQTPVDRGAGLDFAQALRALLRQDPEVLFVGEVRDRETARVATEASLTGHLILTTVHAGDCCEALARLLDLEVEPFALAAGLEQVFAQRLLRRTCGQCAGAGCPGCRHTGYRGRAPLVGHLRLDGALAACLQRGPTLSELRRQARVSGWRPLSAAARAALAEGWTTRAEVARVLGPPDGEGDA